MLTRSDVSNLSEWKKLVDDEVTRACSMYPSATSSDPTQAQNPKNEHGPFYGYWAGYDQVANSSWGNDWVDAQTTWYVAPILDSVNLIGALSDWVGQGGVGSGDCLTQTGTNSFEASLVNVYVAWVENTCYTPDTQEMIITQSDGLPYPVASSDSMYAETVGNFMYIQDYTQGWAFSTVFGPEPDERYADCVREDVDPSTPHANGVPKTTKLTFYSCEAEGANDAWVYMGCNTCDAYSDNIATNDGLSGGTENYYPESPPEGYGDFSVIFNSSFY